MVRASFWLHLQLPSVGSDGEESACNAGDPGFNPWVGKISWRREWLPTLVFLPEEFHGESCLAGYSSWGHKELDRTEQLTLSLFFNMVTPQFRKAKLASKIP